MNIKPLKNNFAFTFVDRVNSKGEFEKERTDSGIYLKGSFDDSAKQPRWVDVIAVGPDCTVVAVGDRVLLPNLRWTSHFKVEDRKVWRSDETEIAAIARSGQLQAFGSFVLFIRTKKDMVRSTGGLYIVGGTSDETPSGTVFNVGPKVDGDLKPGNILYFNDTNFTDEFTFAGIQLAFIKDENILAVDDNGV